MQLGAVFITILTNGMSLIRVQSYVQQIVLGDDSAFMRSEPPSYQDELQQTWLR